MLFRSLDAVNEKVVGLDEKHRGIVQELARAEQQLESLNLLIRWFRGPSLKRRIAGLKDGRQMLEDKLAELRELAERIRGEPLPEPEELSLESRRLINCAIIGLAQHLCLHFAEHDLASLAPMMAE